MARYRCLRKIEFPTGRKKVEVFMPGMIYTGDEPKCGKGTSLLKPEVVLGKKGEQITGPAFELIKEPVVEVVVDGSRTKAMIAGDILKDFGETVNPDKFKKAELLAYEQKLKG